MRTMKEVYMQAFVDEISGERARRDEIEKALDRELPGRTVTHRFMAKYQHHVAGMLAPCIRRWGKRHTEMCDALEQFRTHGQKKEKAK